MQLTLIKKKQHVQEEVNAIWKILKSSDNIEGEVESKIKELQIQMTKKKATLLNFFSKIPSASTSRIQLEREEEGKVQVSSNFITILNNYRAQRWTRT